MTRQRLLVLTAVFGLLLPSFAQRRTTGPGTNSARTTDVTIRVTYPNDRPAEKGIEVSILASNGGIIQQAFTDDIGAAAFRGLNAGRYRVRISGINVETTDAATFEVNPLETVHYEYVHVTPKGGDQAASNNKGGGMISAAELNIPEKARKEFDRGAEAMQKSEDQKALEHFEKATAIYPQYAMAYNNIGVIQIKTGHKAEARQAFETSTSLNPKSASALVNLAKMSMNDEKYPEADQFIAKAMTAEPNRMDVMAIAAQTKWMTGDLDAAYAMARKVHGAGEHKGFSVVHLICASILEQKHQPDGAKAEYKLFLAESPDSPSAPKVRNALARLGDVGAAGK